MKKKISFSVTIFTVLFILGLLVSLQIKNLNFDELEAFHNEENLTLLQEEVMALLQENDRLAADNMKMSAILDSMRADLSGEDESLQAVMDEIKKAETFAGLTNVSGPGIQIQLNEEEQTTVKATELLLLVNEMRTSGALAISINEERVAALTEIRDTGMENPQIVINGNSYPARIAFTVKGLYPAEDVNRGKQLLASLCDAFEKNNTSFSFAITSPDEIWIPGLDNASFGSQ